MTSKTIIVEAEHGLHARPASELVKLAKSLNITVFLSASGKQVKASSMLGILSLGLKKGTQLVVSAEGEAENEAVNTIADFITAQKQ